MLASPEFSGDHGFYDPSILRAHGVTICYSMQAVHQIRAVLPAPNVQKWTLARARTTNEQRTSDSITRTKGR